MMLNISKQVIGLGCALALLLAVSAVSPAQEAPSAHPRDALYKQLVTALDLFERGGRWKDTNSAILGWSCGQQLQTLMCLYQATGERLWLDRLFTYAETMFGNLTPNRDGFLSWRPRGYSDDKQEYDYAVHDGMVLMPISRAIELVKKDKALQAAYSERADKLLRVIETQLIPKCDKYWRETKEGGVYVGQKDQTTLLHNQYLPLGTVQITLHRITGKATYRERAAKMAAFFKSRLRLVNDHYEWRYWDDAGDWDKPVIAKHGDKAVQRPEDTGHGSLDIGFVLACAENGIVFSDTDLQRFANTFVKVMWNGSFDTPTLGGWVNTNKPSRQSANWQEWLLLGRVEPQVRQICERLVANEASLWAKAQLYGLGSNDQRRKRP